MLPLWNNFLMSLLRFVVVISNHDEGLGKISSRSVYLILGWQKKEVGRHEKEEVYELCLQECWQLFVGHLFIGLLPSFFFLCGDPYEASYRFGFEI
jgi:hypothetical protein